MIFAASVHCMDGRIQKPIIEYITENYNVHFVDTVTEPGPCGIISDISDLNIIDSIEKRLNISINIHKAGIIFISGHYDCAGNPVEENIQKKQINKSAEFLKSKYPGTEIVKLWINEQFEVEKID
jgi:carbonic anhydrase